MDILEKARQHEKKKNFFFKAIQLYPKKKTNKKNNCLTLNDLIKIDRPLNIKQTNIANNARSQTNSKTLTMCFLHHLDFVWSAKKIQVLWSFFDKKSNITTIGGKWFWGLLWCPAQVIRELNFKKVEKNAGWIRHY